MFIAFLALLGLFAGFLSGLLGIGGGIVFTPILFYLFLNNDVADPVTFTIASSLFCIILVSASSSVKHIRQQNFNQKESLNIAFFGIIGTSIGKQITTSSYYSEREFALLFTLILLYTSYSFFKKPKLTSANEPMPSKPIHWYDGLLVGGLGGFVAALAGLGGGIVMVPFLNLMYHKPFHQTVSITSFAILVISIAAVSQFAFTPTEILAISPYQLGYVDFGTALPLALGGMIGANRGAKLTMSLNKHFLQRLFAILALIEAVRLLSEHFFRG